MSDIIVLGAGPIGLASAMLLARDGHQVQILEKDEHAPPASGSDAWEQWERSGVAEFRADLVVDAMGRRSRCTDWVTSAGARPPYEESFDAGFAYYSRHYRSRDGTFPEPTGPLVSFLSTFSILTLPADNDTWVVN